jgi:hypothetical protein
MQSKNGGPEFEEIATDFEALERRAREHFANVTQEEWDKARDLVCRAIFSLTRWPKLPLSLRPTRESWRPPKGTTARRNFRFISCARISDWLSNWRLTTSRPNRSTKRSRQRWTALSKITLLGKVIFHDQHR